MSLVCPINKSYPLKIGSGSGSGSNLNLSIINFPTKGPLSEHRILL